MTFEEAMTTQPQWVQIWVTILGAAILLTMIVLLFSRITRIDALIILIANIAVYFVMLWLFEKLGFVRLLGLVHVIFWTPLVFYLWRRLSDAAIIFPFRQAIWLLVGVMLISLAFDISDVARYAMGERGSMIPIAETAPG